MHSRREPRENIFKYRLFMMYLDLDELPRLFSGNLLWSLEKFNLASFRRCDYLGPGNIPLKEAVLDHVEKKLGRRPGGPVRMLTHLRYSGYIFNPVTFYYCFDQEGEDVEAIAAQINNTPWNERHTYVLDVREKQGEGGEWRFRFPKEFHISPFMPMDLSYDWTFRKPGRELRVEMKNSSRDTPFFHVILAMERREITNVSLYRVLLKFPLMTVQVIGRIYWQALKLMIKKVPGFDHP